MENDVSLSIPVPAQRQKCFAQALSGFELDSRQARRALRVSIAINGFGVGTLLPNDLGDRAGLTGLAQQPAC